VITGGAKGIGKAITMKMLHEGASVAIADIDIESCRSLSLICKKNGFSIISIKCDVSKENQIKNMFREVDKAYGKIDIIINNARYLGCQPESKKGRRYR
jgi:NAD(P)-dependent dehydrogenase (short-subunit alcohol dehydrogenase family)